MKPYYLKKKVHVRIVDHYVVTQFSNFAIEYLRENEKRSQNRSYGT